MLEPRSCTYLCIWINLAITRCSLASSMHVTVNEISPTHFSLDTLTLVFSIYSIERRLKWPSYSMKRVESGGSTEVSSLLSLLHTRLHFFSLPFPFDIAILICFWWWFVWERDYFRILKLSQERYCHLSSSKSSSSCHWLCY